MRHPAAPYHEHAVRAEIESICDTAGLPFRRDPFGNVLVELKKGRRARPVVLAAHLDHPGFEILRALSPRRWLARFCGGVPDNYFRSGIALRLCPGGTSARLSRRAGERTFEVTADRPPKSIPQFAVWDLEDFATRRGRIHGRACDDLVGAAAVLAAILELRRAPGPFHVIGALSRAEEVGFHGALAIAATKSLPADALVISLETSRELPGVKMGNGVILRVGDRTSIFDSAAMRFLAEVAADLKARRPGFGFQRGLMSGGTCEATAYQEYGLQTAGVCVALGNYHNCAPRNRIAAEFVSLRDACAMVDLLVAAVRSARSFDSIVGRLPARLDALWRQARQRLRQTA